MGKVRKLGKSNRLCSIWDSYRIFLVRLQSISIRTLTLEFRDLAGKNYFIELAREVENFTFSVLDKFGGVLALVDLYCMYNRARGTDLISPEDLLIACEKMNQSSDKIVLRTFHSGVKVIQASNFITFIYV